MVEGVFVSLHARCVCCSCLLILFYLFFLLFFLVPFSLGFRIICILVCVCVTSVGFILAGARCSSVVRAFAHGAMGRRIDPSWWTN